MADDNSRSDSRSSSSSDLDSDAHPHSHSLEPDRRSLLQTLGLAGVAATAGIPGTGLADDTADDSGDDPDAVGTPRYTLPDLPYGYGALEPHIDRRIVELHHSEHHQGYVDGANEAVADAETMRNQGDYEGLRAVKRDLAFNLSGHVLHSIFWENMSPDGGGTPQGELAASIDERFGSFDAFVSEFSEAAEQVQGPGWALLVYDHLADTLLVTQAEEHQHFAERGTTPLLVLDVWEHAYYLQYENERAEYISQWRNVVDWTDVTRRYEVARAAALFDH